jgi:lipopolysaccharide/colanic/teichoic acid biosynthesis glycosyltransferase
MDLSGNLRPMRLLKRLFDILISLSLILLFLPIFCIIAIFIILFDGLPVLFIQNRIGYKGRSFSLIKFRTMRSSKKNIEESFLVGNSSRVTFFGKFLRKSKLDELPQLVNVLFGSMSFVGPRPELKEWVNAYPDRWLKIHSIKPGITDPASILYRHEEKILNASINPKATYREIILPHKLSIYEKYIDNWSFFGDITILFKTIFSIFR